jgi:hypothetical protein
MGYEDPSRWPQVNAVKGSVKRPSFAPRRTREERRKWSSGREGVSRA